MSTSRFRSMNPRFLCRELSLSWRWVLSSPYRQIMDSRLPCLTMVLWQSWDVIFNKQLTGMGREKSRSHSQADLLTINLNLKEMAYQTGVIEYKGSFKSIRHWKNRKDTKIYAGEKGGANRDLILNNPAFARTRENMNEFGGCGVAVKAIRRGMLQLLPEHADTHFTGRLMKIIKMINLKDPEGKRGKRVIKISLNKTMLKSLNLHEKRKIDFELKRCIKTTHHDSRTEATITINGFNPEPRLVHCNAQYYRVVNHVSIISDYAYTENERRYNPLSPQNRMAA